MKRIFCDGCDQQITFDDENKPLGGRVNMRVNFYCMSNDGGELGQFASDQIDLCGPCIENMKSLINPRNWSRRGNKEAA